MSVKTAVAGLIVGLMLVVGAAARAEEGPRILVMGDSLMAVNRMLGGSVAQALEQQLGVAVEDRSASGARMFFGLPGLAEMGMRIEKQFGGGPWDYVVMNGGGNDLLLGCGCGDCARMVERLISPDGSKGAIPKLVAQVRATGARVIYTGYLRTPGLISPVESCGPVGDEMDRRLSEMARRDKGVQFVLLADLVTQDGDRSYHGIDLVHPSVKGSAAIAARVAALIGG